MLFQRQEPLSSVHRLREQVEGRKTAPRDRKRLEVMKGIDTHPTPTTLFKTYELHDQLPPLYQTERLLDGLMDLRRLADRGGNAGRNHMSCFWYVAQLVKAGLHLRRIRILRP